MRVFGERKDIGGSSERNFSLYREGLAALAKDSYDLGGKNTKGS